MSRYELSISPGYAADWSLADAFRELFQNALDEETVQKDNKMFYDYDAVAGKFSIGNQKSILEAKTLLLGPSSKAEDKRTIGQFGEGYKIAVLVLLRAGKKVTFYNYGKKEVWIPRFVNSRRYGSTILVFETKQYIWKSVPHNNLVITVEGVTPEEYAEVVKTNLHMQDETPVHEVAKGRILLDDAHKGDVYVHGLYVTHIESLQYGYDIKPAFLPLGRDRNMVRTIDITWITSEMWQESGDNDRVLSLIQDGHEDTMYIKYTYQRSQMQAVVEKAKAEFTETYGEKAIPVTSQAEVEEVKMKYKDAEPVVVTESHKHLLTDGTGNFEPEAAAKVEVKDDSVYARLMNWFAGAKRNLYQSEQEEFLEIIAKLKLEEE